MSFKVSTWGIKNPVPVVLLFVALTVAGIAGYMLMPIKQFPEVTFPVVTVTVTQSGAAPSEMETQITRPVEDAAVAVSGVKHISSTVTLGVSVTTVQFQIGTDPQRALDQVRSAIDRIRVNLPAGIDPPNVARFDIDDQPVMFYAVSSSTLSSTDLSWFIDNTVARAVQGVKGVGEVTRNGGLTREINVAIDPDRMAALGVTAPQINQALVQFTDDTGGGRAVIGDRELTVRVLGAPHSVDQLRQLPIPLPSGRYARLQDVADVGDGSAEERGFSMLDGRPVASFQISKTKGFSDVAVEKAVLKAVAKLKADHPEVTFTEILSTVKQTRQSYESTVHVLIEGMALAALVVLLFLKEWRATAISAVAMPLSLVPTFALMAVFNFSLNVVTLLALTLVVGILVDDAIVEIENIQKRIERGARPYAAAIEGAAAIGLAVAATTLTIVVVFLPVSALNSEVGQFFREFGVTVALAVLFSLAVARLMTPLMAAYFLLPARHAKPAPELPRFYRQSLDWALGHKWKAVGLAGLFLVFSVGMAMLLPTGFQPVGDPGYIYMQVDGQPGATRDDMRQAVSDATRLIDAEPDVQSVFAQIGSTDANGDLTNGRLIALLRDKRGHTTEQVKQRLRDRLRSITDARITYLNNGAAADVEVILASQDGEALAAAQQALLRQMRDVKQVSEPRPAPPAVSAELIIRPKPDEAARLGVTADALAQIARIATIGDIDANAPKFPDGERRIPIRVKLPEGARNDLDAIGRLQVPTAGGKTTDLRSVADIAFEAGPGRIVRYDRERRASVQADLVGGATIGQALKAVHRLPIMKSLPPGVREATAGDVENMVDLFGGIIGAMLAGVALIYAVMVLLFRSFFKPLTILSALPLSLGGCFVSLLVTGMALDLPSMIGMLMLLGLAAKNSILLVEFAIEAQRAGMDRLEALHTACRERARPIVMTTVAMTMGMLPTALGIGVGAEWRQPMAIGVIGGLISSTLLSLVLVPVVYEIVDDFEQWLRPKAARLATPRYAQGEAPAIPGE
ncbi:MAG TPA: efflux RND transporter permease subunit [Caulobacteraceae bacterium]|nr:efflux RND transporter permease subunit [Caulobacteraceae bacterium]